MKLTFYYGAIIAILTVIGYAGCVNRATDKEVQTFTEWVESLELETYGAFE